MVLAAAGTLFYIGSATPLVHAKNPAPRASRSMSPVSLPMYFEANQGQTDSRVKFLSRGHGYGLFLTADEAVELVGGEPDHVSPPGRAVPGPARRGSCRGPTTASTERPNASTMAR